MKGIIHQPVGFHFPPGDHSNISVHMRDKKTIEKGTFFTGGRVTRVTHQGCEK